MTNCTQGAFGFPPVKRRRVEAEFSGGQVTSDGGVVLLRQADRRTGLESDALGARLADEAEDVTLPGRPMWRGSSR